jgi:hypothetical protein
MATGATGMDTMDTAAIGGMVAGGYTVLARAGYWTPKRVGLELLLTASTKRRWAGLTPGPFPLPIARLSWTATM